MNNKDFVDAIQMYVRDSAVEGTIETHMKPPGRKPDAGLVARSAWFNRLPPEDVEKLRGMLADAAHAAEFGFLAVLDGVRTIDAEHGAFELFHVGKERVLLNPPNLDLHDLLDRP